MRQGYSYVHVSYAESRQAKVVAKTPSGWAEWVWLINATYSLRLLWQHVWPEEKKKKKTPSFQWKFYSLFSVSSDQPWVSHLGFPVTLGNRASSEVHIPQSATYWHTVVTFRLVNTVDLNQGWVSHLWFPDMK